MSNNPEEIPTSPTAPAPDSFEEQRRSIAQSVSAAPPEDRPEDGLSVQAEFSLRGLVPREEPRHGNYRSQDIYLRLENTVYGPISRDELHELLSGGLLTGYESASSDLRHWTPLLYHPRMHITGQADPDHTHAVLREHTALPAVSRTPRRIDLEALPEQFDEVALPSVPLAKVFKVRKKRGDGLDLPVFADLAVERVEDVIARAREASPSGSWDDPTPEEIDQFAGFLEAAHNTGDAAIVESDELSGEPLEFEIEAEADADAPAVTPPAPAGRRFSGRLVIAALFVIVAIFGGLMLYLGFYR